MNEGEFNQAVTENYAKLVRSAETILHCESAAKDAVQRALVKVWNNLNSFDPKKGAFVTLLHVAVKRAAIDQYRSAVRRLTAMEFFWGETTDQGRPHDDSRMEELMIALKALPEKRQTVIRKYYMEGKSIGEVAAEMGVSRVSVQANLNRARGALRREYRKKLRI